MIMELKNITDEILFKYVLFPDDLSREVKDFIRLNESSFSGQIEFYKSYINSLNSDEISSLANKALQKIPALQNIITLYPVIFKSVQNKNSLTLAAASHEVAAKQSESISYSDENSNYLIRLLKNKDKCVLYFFSKNENKNQKLKITFIPSNHIFHLINKSCQIDIHPAEEIEKILIEDE